MIGLTLALRQVRFENKAFWRNPAAAFFTFAFPLLFLVIFTTIFGDDSGTLPTGQEVNGATYFTATILAFSVITACYTNIAMTVTIARDEGVLKRVHGTPLPGSKLRDPVDVLELAVVNSEASFPYVYRSNIYDYEVTLERPGVVLVVGIRYPRSFTMLEPIEWKVKGAAETVYGGG